jgi:hypothetical protein
MNFTNVIKKHIKDFRVETKSGRIVGHAWHVEQAEHIAHQGKGRWVFKWIDNQYVALRQYN